MERITLEDPRDFLDYREAPGGCVEIVNIIVRSARGEGRGRRMVAILKGRYREKANLIYAITRDSNKIAKAFYSAIGFRLLGKLSGFYRDGEVEDALVYGSDL